MWIVMNTGCLECGVSSKVVGVFADKALADSIARACQVKYDWREGGSNEFEVYALPVPEVIDAEYDVSVDNLNENKC
jgi:hypothetical protein